MTAPIKRHLSRLAIALFCLRSIMPVGFMPDVGALLDGRLEIAVCSGSGLRTIVVDAATGQPLSEHPLPGGKGRASDDSFCAFGSIIAQGLIAPASALLIQPETSGTKPMVFSTATEPPGVRGPPLGSRAPPRTLA